MHGAFVLLFSLRIFYGILFPYNTGFDLLAEMLRHAPPSSGVQAPGKPLDVVCSSFRSKDRQKSFL